MILTFNPPKQYELPPALQRHTCPAPSRTTAPKNNAGAPWSVMRKKLKRFGIDLPSDLLAERSIWISQIVEEATWDMQDESILVSLCDGSEHRWEMDLRREILSSEFVDSEDDSSNEEAGLGASERKFERPSATELIYSSLLNVSLELKTAFDEGGFWELDEEFFEKLVEFSLQGEIVWDEEGYDGGEGFFRAISPIFDGDEDFDELDETARRGDHSDVVHFIKLLQRTRHLLFDLFAKTIIPHLKTILPPTYSVFAATSTAEWCKRTAIRKGAEVAKHILTLIENAKNFLADESDHDFKTDSEVDDDDLDLPCSRRGHVMLSMIEDLDLINWCYSAIYKEEELDDVCGGGQLFFDEDAVKPWDVTKPYERGSSLNPSLRSKSWVSDGWMSGKNGSKRPSYVLFGASPPASDDEDAEGEDDETDLEDDGWSDPKMFEPDNSLDATLLPPRLPLALVRRGDVGSEAEAYRAKIHRTLNEISGLQKKIIELTAFAETETEEFEAATEKQKQIRNENARSNSSSPPPPPLSRVLASKIQKKKEKWIASVKGPLRASSPRTKKRVAKKAHGKKGTVKKKSKVRGKSLLSKVLVSVSE